MGVLVIIEKQRLFLIVTFLILISLSISLGSALAQTPPNPKSLYQKAEQNFWNKRYKEAERYYRRLVNSASESSYFNDALFGLARSCFKQGKLIEAARRYRQVRRQHPSKKVRADALFGGIEVALMQNNKSKARKLLQNFLQKYPDHVLHEVAQEKIKKIAAAGKKEKPDKKKEITSKTELVVPADTTGEEQEFSISPGQTSKLEEERDTSSGPVPEDLPPLKLSVVSETMTARETTPVKPGIPEQVSDTAADTKPAKIAPLRKELERLRRRNQDLLSELRQKVEQNRKFISLSKKYKDRLKKLQKQNNELQKKNERLITELSRKISTAFMDTRLYHLPDKIDLNDTAMKSLKKNIQNLRNQVEKAIDLGEYEIARNNIHKILSRQPEITDFFNAARIYWKLQQDTQPALKYLREALKRSETVPIDHLLLKAEILSRTGLEDQLDQFMSTWSDRITDKAKGAEKARWNLILARRLISAGKKGEAFFKLMSAVKAAPESKWARQARKIIKNEL